MRKQSFPVNLRYNLEIGSQQYRIKEFIFCLLFIYYFILLLAFLIYIYRSVQSLSHVWLFATPWTVARQASLSITNSWSLLTLMSIKLVMPSTISSSVFPFSSYLQSFLASESFPMSQFFASGGQSIGVSASASVLPMNVQDLFPVGWTGWISLQSKGLSRSSPAPQFKKHQFFGALYSPTLTSICDY